MSGSVSQLPKIYYSGLNSSYSVDDRQLILTNISAKNNELLNLMTTVPGEVAFEPDFGSQVPKLVFEQPTSINNWMIGNFLFVAVAKWIPEIKIDFKDSLIDQIEDAVFLIKLFYSIDGLSNTNEADFRFQT